MNRLFPGEFMVVGFEGDTVNPALRKYVLEWRVAGVILFKRNITRNRTAALLRELGKLRREISDLPLLIAVDQEGGSVCRFREGVTFFPGNMALGISASAEEARRQGKITAEELRRKGVNMNLAPVLDLYSPSGSSASGIRSLGSDPRRVALLGEALIRGMQEAGIVATAKHFPGKGKASLDSHLSLPVINRSAHQLESEDLVPFRAAIGCGVKAIMTSHAAYPAFQGKINCPSTLSPEVLKGILRRELKFENLIITDDLGMGAIRDYCPVPEASRLALKAGADMVLLCHSAPEREKVFSLLSEAVKKDKALARELRESGERIRRVKSELRDFSPLGLPRKKESNELAERIARRAVRVLRDRRRSLPFDKKKETLLIRVRPERTVEVENRESAGLSLEDCLIQEGLPTKSHDIGVNPSGEEIESCLRRAKKAERLLLTSYDAYNYQNQIRLLEALLKEHPDAVLAVLKDPRDAGIFPRAACVIASFGFSPPSLRALAGVISGRIEAENKAPGLAGIGPDYT